MAFPSIWRWLQPRQWVHEIVGRSHTQSQPDTASPLSFDTSCNQCRRPGLPSKRRLIDSHTGQQDIVHHECSEGHRWHMVTSDQEARRIACDCAASETGAEP